MFTRGLARPARRAFPILHWLLVFFGMACLALFAHRWSRAGEAQIEPTTDVIATLAGTGVHGVAHQSNTPLFIPMTHDLWEVALYEDGEDDILYVADRFQACAIYELKDGAIDVLAGGRCGHMPPTVPDPLNPGGPEVPPKAVGAALDPYSVAVDDQGIVYIADVCAVWRVDPSEPAETRKMVRVAGNFDPDSPDPMARSCDPDSGEISPPNPGGITSPTGVKLGGSYDVAAAADGNIYISQPTGAYKGVRRISPDSDGRVDGTNAEDITRIYAGSTLGIAADAHGNLYVSQANKIYFVSNASQVEEALIANSLGVTNVAGDGTDGYLDATAATAGRLRGTGFPTGGVGGGIWGMAVSGDGHLYIADRNNCRIRMVTPGDDDIVNGGQGESLTTVVGSPDETETCVEGITGSHMTPNDYGPASQAILHSTAYGVDVSADGDTLYLTDQHRVRVVSEDDDPINEIPVGDGVPDAMERFFGTDPRSLNTDGDTYGEVPSLTHSVNTSPLVDTCSSIPNDNQSNVDRNSIRMLLLPQNVLLDDWTRVDSDGAGDPCDGDSDNDRIDDQQEQLYICGGSSDVTSAFKVDTDGDLIPDWVECLLGSDAANAAYGPAMTPDSDSDGSPDEIESVLGTSSSDSDSDDDGLSDGTELRANSNALAPDGDGDGCNDIYELASVNSDRKVSSIDYSLVSQRLGLQRGDAYYLSNMDINRNGTIDQPDLTLILNNLFTCP